MRRKIIFQTALALQVVILLFSTKLYGRAQVADPPIQDIQWTLDGKLAVARVDGITIYDAQSNQIGSIDVVFNPEMAWSPDGQLLAFFHNTFDQDLHVNKHFLEVWNIASMSPVMDGMQVLYPGDIIWSPNSQSIFISFPLATNREDRSIEVISADIPHISIPDGEVIGGIDNTMLIDPALLDGTDDGRYLVGSDTSNMLVIWDTQTSNVAQTVEVANGVSNLIWSPDGIQIAIVDSDGRQVDIINPTTGIIHSIEPVTSDSIIMAIDWKQDILALSLFSPSQDPNGNTIEIWQPSTREHLATRNIQIPVYDIALSSDAIQIALGGHDNYFISFDPLSGVISGQLWRDSDFDGLRSPDETTGIPDITVNLYDETDTLVNSATSAPDGGYSFEAEPDHTYTVEVVSPATNQHFSPANAGSDDEIDSDFDPETGRSEAISVGVAQQIDLDAGLLPLGYLPYQEDFENGASNWITQNGWAVSDEAVHDGSFAMSDSPGTDYTVNNNAILELAHPLYLTNATYEVQLSYWTRYSFDIYHENYQYAYVEVSTDEGVTWETLDNEFPRDDPNNVLNQELEWFQQTLDLTPYLGQVIRLRFRLFTAEFSQPGDGWWIDEINIAELLPTTYPLPFTEDFEAIQNLQNDARWQSSTWTNYWEGYASTRSAFTYPMPTDNTSFNDLNVQGILDLRGVTQPELRLWTAHNLPPEATGYVEVSRNNGNTWETVFTASGRSSVSEGQPDWVEQTIPLDEYVGDLLRLRFRLDSTVLGNKEQGWWVDNLRVQAAVPLYELPFQANFNDGAALTSEDWVASVWETDEFGFSATAGMTTRVNLTDETTPNRLTLVKPLNLVNAYSTELTLWTQYELPVGVTGQIQVTSDGGQTWQTIHSVSGQSLYNGYVDWISLALDLRPYQGQPLSLRFDLPADVTDVQYYWRVDEIMVDGEVLPTLMLPFQEDFENDTDVYDSAGYWRASDTWSVFEDWTNSTQSAYTFPVITTSETRNQLDLVGVLDLRGWTEVSLNLTTRYQLPSEATGYIEVSTDDGHTWSALPHTFQGRSSEGEGVPEWIGVEVDLSAYVDELIMLRFRLESTVQDNPGEDWWIEHLQVVGAVTEADLRLTQTLSGELEANSPIAISLAVTNLGPSVATQIVVADTLPSELSVISLPSECTELEPLVLECQWATLPVGESAIFSIEALLTTNVPSLSNTAFVGAEQPDPDLENNTATATLNPILPTPTLPPLSNVLSVGFYEESYEDLDFYGDWVPETLPGPSGDGHLYTYDPSARLVFQFEGDGLAIYRALYVESGDMEVCIDGNCTVVSNYSPDLQWSQAAVFGNLGIGVHTADIRNQNIYMDIDAVEVLAASSPTPTPTPGVTPTPMPTPTLPPLSNVLSIGFYEESYEDLDFYGDWLPETLIGPSGDGHLYTYDPTARLVFQFEGDGLAIYRALYSDSGNMEVCIDGTCTIVSNYSPDLQWSQAAVFENLGLGVHTADIRNQHIYMDIDAIEVLAGD